MDQLVQSLFYTLFGDPVANPMGWKECELQSHADIKSGVTKGRKFGDKKTVYAPYMRVANVQDGHLVLDDITEVEVLPSDVEKYKLIKNDILLTEGGDPDKLGRGAIWQGEVDSCIHQNHIFRVRLNGKYLLPEYASKLIGSSRGKRYFFKMAKQTTGIASINMGQLKKCPMLLPPMSLQNEFAKRAEKIEAQKAAMTASLSELEDTFHALMQRAFRGEM
jgi:type I restriction enzyme S subunit